MEVKDYEELKKKVCKELEEIKSTGKMGMAEIEIIDKLTHTIKNLDKIIEDEEGGYSQAGYSQGRYSRRANDGSYGGESYAGRRGSHYVRGHYSMGDGRYSYADGMDAIIDQMEDMIDDPATSPDVKASMRKAMNLLQH